MHSQAAKQSVNRIVGQVTELVRQVQELDGLVRTLGTPQELRGTRNVVANLKRNIEDGYENVVRSLNDSRAVLDLPTFNKISGEIQKISVYCRKVFAVLAEKESIAGGYSLSGNDGRAGGQQAYYEQQQLQQQQQQQRNSQQILSQLQLIEQEDSDQAILREHREGMVQIAEEMSALKELFSDVQAMVGVQGEQLKQAESNTQEAVIQTVIGVQELKEADSLKSSIRKRKIYFILCFLATIVIVGVALGIYYGLKDR